MEQFIKVIRKVQIKYYIKSYQEKLNYYSVGENVLVGSLS